MLFYINSKKLELIQNFNIGASLKNPISNFDFQVHCDFVNQIFLGDIFTISDEAGIVYFTGLISEQREIYKKDSKYIQYSGKNLPGFLNRDSSDPLDFKGKSMKSIVTEIVSEANVSGYNLQLDFDPAADFLIPKFKPEFGQSVLDVIVKLAGKKGLYLYYTPDNVLHFGKPKESGNPIRKFDFDEGVDADFEIMRSITDAATDIVIKGLQKAGRNTCPGDFFSEVACRYDSVKLTGSKASSFSGVAGSYNAKSKAKSGDKYSGTIENPTMLKFFEGRKYTVLGTYRNPPIDGGEFRQLHYFEMTNDSYQTLEEQKEKFVKDSMPKFSIKLNFDHVELPRINELYTIKWDKIKVKDNFLLSDYTISKSDRDSGKTTMTFTLPGFFS